jgi:RNA polymerase sigma-70 factor (ECF subfamily)
MCINHLQSARVQREEYPGQWLPEPIVTGPGSDPLEIICVDESLSMAFLVMLERLTPVERAVFLLREIFEYKYTEIAGVLAQSEANCRQILSRAKLLLEGFLKATSSGDMEELIAVLSSDAVLHSDSGGKAIAVPNVIHGASKVAQGILGGLGKLVPKTLVSRLALVNGDPGVVSYLNGRPYSVLALQAGEGGIDAIFIVTNPDKLTHIPGLPADAN